MNPTCKTCRWWEGGYYGNRGQCHGGVPLVFVERQGDELVHDTVWPLTKSTDFCKEHDPVETPQSEG